MSNKYMCNDCKTFFLEEDADFIKDDPSPAGVGLPQGYEYYMCCPSCHSSDYDYAGVCEICHEDIEPGERLCSDCKKDVEKTKKHFSMFKSEVEQMINRDDTSICNLIIFLVDNY